MIIESFPTGPLGCNCSLVVDPESKTGAPSTTTSSSPSRPLALVVADMSSEELGDFRDLRSLSTTEAPR
jgi:hypothetical protein